MELNVKILVTSKEENPLEEPILVSDELEQVNYFKYLRNQFSYDLKSLTDIKSRIAIATAAMVKLNPIWKTR